MKFSFIFTFIYFYSIILFSLVETKHKRVIFFLHNRFLENHELNENHPEYGRTEYLEIIKKFKNRGFKVISEKREGNVNARSYALKILQQIQLLLKSGTPPNNITVVGTSKGGYIAQYVSTLANIPDLNFVFIGCFQDSDIENIPEINYCGNILSIYEKSDPYGVSAKERIKTSACEIENFKEIALNTKMKHGFLFKALDEWIQPTIRWAEAKYH